MNMKKKSIELEIYERQAEICGALANPVRLMILDRPAEAEETATSLQAALEIPRNASTAAMRLRGSTGPCLLRVLLSRPSVFWVFQPSTVL